MMKLAVKSDLYEFSHTRSKTKKKKSIFNFDLFFFNFAFEFEPFYTSKNNFSSKRTISIFEECLFNIAEKGKKKVTEI